MPTHYYTQHKEKLKLSEKPFASGGEGSLYKIISPSSYKNSVAKVYHPPKRSSLRQEKIQYLQENPPISSQIASTAWYPVLVWPRDILYAENGEFVGLVMPLVKGQKLEVLCSSKLPKALQNGEWSRFNLQKESAIEVRMKLCYNIAAAIHDVHSTSEYILIDLKPDNVMVRPDGVVSLVDMDSVEVVKNGQTLYGAPVATPEYTPPENYLKNLDYDPTQQEAWDRFSMGVIFYKLLLGIHPFAASCNAPYDKATSLHQKIEHGLFVHNPNKKDLFMTVPQPHQNFWKLEKGICDLFMRCFVAGHDDPQLRPTAEEWCYVLSTGQILVNDYPPPSSKFFVPAEISSLLPDMESIEVAQMFEPPEFEPLSIDAYQKLKVRPSNLDKITLSDDDKRELRGTRFANLLFLIFLITATTALSIVSPLAIAAIMGLFIYLGLSLWSYRNRNFGSRRQLLKTTLQEQKKRFDKVIDEIKSREMRVDKLLHYIRKGQKRFKKKEIEQAQRYQEQAKKQRTYFKKYITAQNKKTKALAENERTALQQLYLEFNQRLRENEGWQEIKGLNLEQKLKYINHLKEETTELGDKMHFAILQEQLETLQKELMGREDIIRTQYYQEYQKLMEESEIEYDKLQNALQLYQNAIPKKEHGNIQHFFQQQGSKIRQLEGIKHQINQLEPDVENRLKDYHRIKIEMDRYEDFGFGKHLLQMLFLKK
ncbi:MAG: hypothetical protein GY810_11150 [Aureispira sp.]|nr:hypothetical protein [Aureispira sp.]